MKAKARRTHKPNPTLAIASLNPGGQSRGSVIFGREVHEIRYTHALDGGAYVHKFMERGTRMEALVDGSIRIFNIKHRLWMED